MKRWPIIVGVFFALVMGTPASGGKNGKEKVWDLSKAQSIKPVRECIDGCLRNDEGQAVMHLHFTFTCDLCGTSVDVLLFRGYDDQGIAWTYSATFSNHNATSSARSRRGIDPMVSDFKLRECLQGSRFGTFHDMSGGNNGSMR